MCTAFNGEEQAIIGLDIVSLVEPSPPTHDVIPLIVEPYKIINGVESDPN